MNSLHALFKKAETDLIAAMRDSESEPGLKHFRSIRQRAKDDASTVADNPVTLRPNSVLWQLREPGFLRDACEYPVPKPPGSIMMAPVLVAWGYLGAAEYWYQRTLSSDPDSVRDGFFTAWTRAPYSLGPATMALVLVVTMLLVMARYWWYGRAVAAADRVDAIAHELEAALATPVDTLLSALPAADQSVALRDAATALGTAATRFGHAASTVEGASAGLRRFSKIADRLNDLGPTLNEQILELRTAGSELGAATAQLATEGDALRTAVGETLDAAREARTAEIAATTAATETSGAAARAAAAERAITDQVVKLDRINDPFIEAVLSVSDTADTLNDVVKTARDVAERLNTAVDRANWIALVADGLRPESGTGRTGKGDEDTDQPPAAS